MVIKQLRPCGVVDAAVSSRRARGVHTLVHARIYYWHFDAFRVKLWLLLAKPGSVPHLAEAHSTSVECWDLCGACRHV